MARKTVFTTISVTPDVRDRVKELKRGGESYDEVLDRMADQYDSTDAAEGNA